MLQNWQFIFTNAQQSSEQNIEKNRYEIKELLERKIGWKKKQNRLSLTISVYALYWVCNIYISK